MNPDDFLDIDGLADGYLGGNTIRGRMRVRTDKLAPGQQIEVTPVVRFFNDEFAGPTLDETREADASAVVAPDLAEAGEVEEHSFELPAPAGPDTAEYGNLEVEWRLEFQLVFGDDSEVAAEVEPESTRVAQASDYEIPERPLGAGVFGMGVVETLPI